METNKYTTLTNAGTNHPPTNHPPLDEVYELAVTLAERAGELLRHERSKGAPEVRLKAARDFVTEVDEMAEALIINSVSERYPQHHFLAEESAADGLEHKHAVGAWWIIDPIDGTVNFARGLSHTAVSIAYAVDGEVLVGAVYAPFLDQMYAARKGAGATCNGMPLHVSSRTDLGECLIATGFPACRDTLPRLTAQAHRMLSVCQDIRRFGAASLDVCSVAAGIIDGYYEDIKPWDIAAAGLIAREAGARTGVYREEPKQNPLPSDLQATHYVASTPGIFDAMKEELRNGSLA